METNLQEKNSSQTSPGNKNPKQEPSNSPQSPSSTSSSPSHEFSFTISLQPLSSSSSSSSYSKPNPSLIQTTSSSSHQTDSFAVDLSPADDIFFHGHLLPLHLLSHLPVSPRTSTGSLDGFALPVKDILYDKPTLNHNATNHLNNNSNNNIDLNNSSTVNKNTRNIINNVKETSVINCENRGKNKPIKSFSLFNLSKWRRGLEAKERVDEEQEEDEDKVKQQQKKKLVSLDLSHALKKYIRMLFHRRENGTQFMRSRQAYSFSSASTVLMGSRRNNYSNSNGYSNNSGTDLRGRRRRGEFSAPASMRTSPTNSGHLRGISTTSSSNSCSTSSDSTMEELQAAIQAAIAHCKNSNAVHDRDS